VLTVADAYQLITTPVAFSLPVTTVTGDVQYANSGSGQFIQIWGTNGYYGPIILGGSFSRGAIDTTELAVPDIGDLVAVKLWNTGNDGWLLDSLTVGWGTNYTWTYGQFLDGNGGYNSPHADMSAATGGDTATDRRR
jgi:hypothetical protein